MLVAFDDDERPSVRPIRDAVRIAEQKLGRGIHVLDGIINMHVAPVPEVPNARYHEAWRVCRPAIFCQSGTPDREKHPAVARPDQAAGDWRTDVGNNVRLGAGKMCRNRTHNLAFDI